MGGVASMRRFMKAVIITSVICSAMGCGKKEYTLKDIMGEVNEAHRKIVQHDGNYEKYIPLETDKQSYFSKYLYNPQNKFSGELILSEEQIAEDMDILFDIFQTDYSLYQYFGGSAVFDKAKNDILDECKKMEPDMTGQMLEDILLRNLSFIKDGHFSINRKVDGLTIPFFFREMEFVKTKSGYATKEGNKVLSIDGYSSLDELLKRSVSKTGEIVYYPIVFEKREYINSIFEQQLCTKKLNVNLSDGSTKTLTAEPYQICVEENDQNITFLEKENIPIIVTRGFSYNNGGNQFMTSGKDLKDEPIVILNLCLNPGGDGKIALGWLEQYAGGKVPSNTLIFYSPTKQMKNNEPDQFIRHDNLLIVLTGKYSASASELLIDKAYNLENTIFIGENTMGTMIGMDPRRIQLPNSRISLTIASALGLPPENSEYFEELRGFYPDLWVPAAEAQDAAIRLINYYK